MPGPQDGLSVSLCVWAFFGSLCEYMVHFTFAVARYVLTKRLPRKKIGRTRAASAARPRGCANAAPAAMPPPTEAREGCSGLMGDACAARQLDGGVSTADDHLTVDSDANVVVGAEH